ncbi:MAG: InlB B-repeat-containing protein [Streptococcaceae bacterium]|nr:InlB B-repeat-containing protein [Streptococcaceae bacterium]MCL2858216.1 InlB B-repeat-containing protein [Streptococcaceae bacterium]
MKLSKNGIYTSIATLLLLGQAVAPIASTVTADTVTANTTTQVSSSAPATSSSSIVASTTAPSVSAPATTDSSSSAVAIGDSSSTEASSMVQASSDMATSAKTVVSQAVAQTPAAKSTTQPKTVTTFAWGTCTVTYDDATGIAHISAGTTNGASFRNMFNASIPGGAASQPNLTQIIFDGPVVAAAGNQPQMFRDFSGLKEITNLTYLDTSNLTSFYQFFYNCSSLTSVDVSNFTTAQATNFVGMFQMMTNLQSLDLSNFNTSNGTNMSWMFANDRALTSLNISSLDTSKNTVFDQMFSRDPLTSLDLSNFDTSQGQTFVGMFGGMQHLSYLDISSFDTSNASSLLGMFNFAGVPTDATTLSVPSTFTSDITDFTLKIGPKFTFTGNPSTFDGASTYLSSIPVNAVNTGNWQNVSTGTVTHPTGTTIWDSPTFMTSYNGSLAETYVWQRVAFTASFDSQGGSSVPSQTVYSGDQVTQPTPPTKPGYTFGGWYTDASCTTAYDFSTAVTGDITLYAKWTQDTTTPPSSSTPPVSSTPVTSGASSTSTSKSTSSTSAHQPELPKTGDTETITLISAVGVVLVGFAVAFKGKKSKTNK